MDQDSQNRENPFNLILQMKMSLANAFLMKQYPCHMYDLEQGCFSPKVSRAALLLLGSELHYWENQGYSELLHEVLPTSVLIWEHSWVMNTGISR